MIQRSRVPMCRSSIFPSDSGIANWVSGTGSCSSAETDGSPDRRTRTARVDRTQKEEFMHGIIPKGLKLAKFLKKNNLQKIALANIRWPHEAKGRPPF